jgi:hypothetical protein
MNNPVAHELDLYRTDRAAWIALASPRIAARIAAMNDAQIDYCWPTMQFDLRKKVWKLLDDVQKARVTAVRPLDAQTANKAA